MVQAGARHASEAWSEPAAELAQLSAAFRLPPRHVEVAAQQTERRTCVVA
jgi:hypothetical protein